MRREAPPEVIARARHDRAAFGELYDLYLPRVYAFCRKHSATREEAEDLTAVVFERALSAISRYEEREVPLSRWLLRIAANALIDHARRSGRLTRVDQELELIADESQLEQWERAYWLLTHVQALPPDQQEVVRLRFYEDQRFRDVAARMGRSEGAVKQLLRRAIEALHVQLRAEAEKEAGDD